MALSNIPGYFYAKLAPTYSTSPTTGGCVVFISGHTGASIGSTVTDTFGPIIVPPGGCVFTGATTNSLKRLSAVAIRPGYNDVSEYYIEGTGATINPQLRKAGTATSFDLLTGAATKAANSGRCPTEEDVYEYATKAALISSTEVDEAKRCLSRDEYPLWDTMYTSAVYSKMIPTYSKLYYDCSSNVLSGCSSNDSLICELDGTLCTSNCSSDGTTCSTETIICTCQKKEVVNPTLATDGKLTLNVQSRVSLAESSAVSGGLTMEISTDGTFTGVTSTTLLLSVSNGVNNFSLGVSLKSTFDVIMCYQKATYIKVAVRETIGTTLVGTDLIWTKGTTTQTATCYIGGTHDSYTFSLS